MIKWIHLGHQCDEWIHLCVHTLHLQIFSSLTIFFSHSDLYIRQQMSLSLVCPPALSLFSAKKLKTDCCQSLIAIIINLFQSLSYRHSHARHTWNREANEVWYKWASSDKCEWGKFSFNYTLKHKFTLLLIAIIIIKCLVCIRQALFE